MHPLYYNPTSIPSNYVGTNPIASYSVATTHQMQPSYYNPNLYNSFTFNSILNQSQVTYSTYLGGSSLFSTNSLSGPTNTLGGNTDPVNPSFSYLTVQFFSTLQASSTQFSTYLTIYATDVTMQSVTFSYRFGTQLQTLYFSDQASTDYTLTYENVFLETIEAFSIAVETFYQPSPSSPWQLIGDTVTQSGSLVLGSMQSGLPNAIVGSSTSYLSNAGYFTASSTFVNMLGSDVYTGLLVTTNSVIIYNNEQVSTYYSESLSYQINIANLTAALNSVSGTSYSALGSGIITVTNFSWAWTSLPGTGWTGSQVTNYPGYSYQTYVNSYLSNTYSGTIITNSSEAVTQVQSLITVENNDLSNAQTFLNNAVTTLQSQVSLAGQIIGSLASATQSIISNMS